MCIALHGRAVEIFFFSTDDRKKSTDRLIARYLSNSNTAPVRGLHYNFALRRHFCEKEPALRTFVIRLKKFFQESKVQNFYFRTNMVSTTDVTKLNFGEFIKKSSKKCHFA